MFAALRGRSRSSWLAPERSYLGGPGRYAEDVQTLRSELATACNRSTTAVEPVVVAKAALVKAYSEELLLDEAKEVRRNSEITQLWTQSDMPCRKRDWRKNPVATHPLPVASLALGTCDTARDALINRRIQDPLLLAMHDKIRRLEEQINEMKYKAPMADTLVMEKSLEW